MRWLDKIRSEPLNKKVRLIWIIIACAFVILVALWVVVGNYHQNSTGQSPIQSISNSIKDAKNGGH